MRFYRFADGSCVSVKLCMVLFNHTGGSHPSRPHDLHKKETKEILWQSLLSVYNLKGAESAPFYFLKKAFFPSFSTAFGNRE